MKNVNLVQIIIGAVAIGALAFFGGMKYQQSQAVLGNSNGQYTQNSQNDTGNSQGRFGRRGGFGGATVGTIISADANSIVVKLQDGSSKIINLSSNTTISKTDTASKSDLSNGVRVAAFGAANSDGSITAQNIQINPMLRGPGGQRMQPSPTQ